MMCRGVPAGVGPIFVYEELAVVEKYDESLGLSPNPGSCETFCERERESVARAGAAGARGA